MTTPADMTKDEERALQLLFMALDLLAFPAEERAAVQGYLLNLARIKRGVV